MCLSSLGLHSVRKSRDMFGMVGGLFVQRLFVQRHFVHVFYPIFFCPTTFGPISKKRSLVKGTLTPTLNQTPNPNPKPYWTKRRGQSVVGPKVFGRKVGTRSRILC